MNSPIFVCPNDQGLLGGFTGYAVAVRVSDPADIVDAVANVQDAGNELYCVIVQTDQPLSELKFHDEQLAVPLAVMAPSMGNFRALAKNVGSLRRPTLRVYLPCNNPDNLAALRILSSLGIHSCAEFVTGTNDWDALADLATYAVLGRNPHASIEPFSFIASSYNPHSTVAWGSIEFDDPTRYLHLDKKGQVALSRDELRRGVFAAGNIGEIGSQALTSAIVERANAWRQFFVDNHACASCAGWKICLGKFADDLPEDGGCTKFFSELIDVAATLKASAPHCEEDKIWRP
jgi:hypothetical protein